MESFVYFIHISMQVVAMAQRMTALHYQYAPLIISLGINNDNILKYLNRSVITGFAFIMYSSASYYNWLPNQSANLVALNHIIII